MGEFNQNEYIKEYDRKTYKKFAFRVKKDEAEKITDFIRNNTNLSINEFFKQAVDEKIEKIKKGKNTQ